jgi:hypothetical protein
MALDKELDSTIHSKKFRRRTLYKTYEFNLDIYFCIGDIALSILLEVEMFLDAIIISQHDQDIKHFTNSYFKSCSVRKEFARILELYCVPELKL